MLEILTDSKSRPLRNQNQGKMNRSSTFDARKCGSCEV